MPKPGTPLKDTAFSVDRLFVWAIGAYIIIGGLGMVLLALFNKPIPMQLATTTAVAIGAFAGRIEQK